ncbi:hypothetical protein, partial [Paenibacillus graminis]|uniref:hypothetical protein n=1 Tax=Paenibacillus graminis TaxID=189425 RepID=UPI002DBC5C2D
AQQTIARKQLYIEKLELSRENAQQAADDIAREKGLELFEARQTIARQREHFKGIHRIIVSAYSHTTQEQLRSVLTSAEWACAEALDDLKVEEGEIQP